MPINIGGIQIPDAVRPSLLSIAGASAAQTAGQLRYGVPYAVEKQLGTASPQDEQFYQQGLAASRAPESAGPAQVSDLTSGRVGLGRFVAENFAASLPQTVGTLVGGVGGGLVGGVRGAIAGSIAAGSPMFVGSNVDRSVQEDGTLSQGAAARSLLAAPVQAASDALVERYLPGAGHVVGDLAATQTGGFLTRTAKSIVKAGATEAVAEASQQLLERAAAGLPVASTDAAAEYVNAAVTAFGVGGVIGAGGGFRRHAADAKPANAVTNDDMTSKIDDFLAPKPAVTPAITPTQNPTYQKPLALPAPADVAVDSRGVAAVGPGAAEALTQDQLDARRFMTEQPVAPVDPATLSGAFQGEAAPVADIPPAFVSPGSVDFPASRLTLAEQAREAQVPEALRATPPAAAPDLRSTTSPDAIAAAQAGVTTAPEPIVPAIPRLFVNDSLDDLNTTIKHKKVSDEARAEAQTELQHRYSEAAGTTPLTTQDYQQRVTELKDGLRGSFVSKLTAADPTELVNKVYDQVLVNQDTASSVTKLAQRVGLLDADLNPTPMADAIEAQRTADVQRAAISTPAAPVNPVGTATVDAAPAAAAPAAPIEAAPAPAEAVSLAPQTADPAFGQEWSKLQQQAGISRARSSSTIGTPVNLEDAQQRVFRALASDSNVSTRGASQTEKLAQQMGLITNDDARDITPLGHKVFLGTPEGRTEISNAAIEKGFDGDAKSTFEAGVRAELTGSDPNTYTSFQEVAAHEAGKVWARNYMGQAGRTQTAAQTEAFTSRIGGARALTPAQEHTQVINNMISAADLRAVNDSDVAALRRMAREGAPVDDVAAALQQVQGGKTLFQQTAPTQSALPTAPTRGQPIFKEVNTPVNTTTRTQVRTETEGAVRAYGLRQLIDFAKNEGGMTARRAEALHAMLDDGKIDQVARLTKSFDMQAANQSFGTTSAAFEADIAGKSFNDIAQHMVDNAPSAQQGAVMKAVLGMAKKLQTLGTAFAVNVVGPGDTAPASLGRAGVRAHTVLNANPGEATVYLKSGALGEEAGTNYQMAAHEMIHAVTAQAIQYAQRFDPQGKTQLGRDVRGLTDLADQIIAHVNGRLDRSTTIALQTGSLEEMKNFEFELGHALGEHNAFQNQEEILAWGLTNPLMQRYLQGIEYKPKQTVFQKLVSLVRDMFGIPAKATNALEQLTRVSEQILGASNSDLGAVFNRSDPDAGATITLDVRAGGATTATGTTELTRRAADLAVGLADKLPLDNLRGKVRRTGLYISSQNHIDETYGRELPGLLEKSAAERAGDAIRSRISALAGATHQTFEALRSSNRALADKMEGLMQATTTHQIDPDKAWADHAHLDQTDARLKRLYNEAVKVKNDLSRGDGAAYKLFTEVRQHNEMDNYARMASDLHALVTLDPEFKLGVHNAGVNPADAFMTRGDIGTTAAARAYWQSALNDQIKAAQDFVTQKKGEASTGTPADQRGMAQHLSPIEAKVADIYKGLQGMARAPYFHLGRFGDYFASAVIAKNEDGTTNMAAQRKVAEAIDKAGFTGVNIDADNTNPKLSSRFDTADQANKFHDLMKDLHAQGLLDPDINRIKKGTILRDVDYGTAGNRPAWVQSYIQNIEQSPTFIPDENATATEKLELAKKKAQAIQLANDAWVASMPANAASKVLTARYTVLGESPEMMRSFAHRANVGARTIANIATSPKLNQADLNMRAQIAEAQQAGNDQDPHRLTDVYSEVRKRDALSPINAEANSFQTLRQVSHAYFLGMSPAYSAIQLMQVGTNALPELAKKNGYGKSFHALRRATPAAFAVMKAAISEAQKGGWAHRADVVLSDKVLSGSGITTAQAEFLRHMIASGSIDIGASAHAIGTVAREGGASKLDIASKYASAMGMYAETMSRLMVSLAAHDMHGGTAEESAKYARSVVSESMFDYQSRNTARALGKQGFAGPITPLLTQFMTYSAQMTEKLYREATSAIGKARPGESPAATAARAAESRKFLAGHLTAVTALAGTLGLPFASVFAAAAERAFGTKDEPLDATATWRNFLSSVLGKDMGEAAARGVPRSLGFDISARVGESDLLPFSQFLGDRRSWKESVSAALGRSGGAAPDMLMNIADGGAQFASGDVLGGMKAMLPVALKGPTEAYRMSTEGYVDSRGQKLPMTPGARDILVQLLGFAPADKAEYSEARGDQVSRRLQITARARQLTSGIVRAMTNGDQDGAKTLIAKAQEFDEANPTFAVIPGLSGALDRQARTRATARAIGTPLGVNIQDIAGRALTGYANVDYR